MYSILEELKGVKTGMIHSPRRPAGLILDESIEKGARSTVDNVNEYQLTVSMHYKFKSTDLYFDAAKQQAKKVISQGIYAEFLQDIDLIITAAYAEDTTTVVDIAESIKDKILGNE